MSERQVGGDSAGDEHEYVRAAYDYEATSREEISFSEGERIVPGELVNSAAAGDLIRIVDRSEDGWWTGEKDGVRGHFPSMLVEELADGEEEEEEEEEAEEEAAFGDGSESGGGSAGSPEPVTPKSAPPPTFAPPKPIQLVPQQIVIMQPTPEIESKGTFGEVMETTDDVVSTDDGLGEENSEHDGGDTAAEAGSEKASSAAADAESEADCKSNQVRCQACFAHELRCNREAGTRS